MRQIGSGWRAVAFRAFLISRVRQRLWSGSECYSWRVTSTRDSNARGPSSWCCGSYSIAWSYTPTTKVPHAIIVGYVTHAASIQARRITADSVQCKAARDRK